MEFTFNNFDKTEDKPTTENQQKSKRRSVQLTTRDKKTIYRRAFSETQLMDISPLEFENNCTYNYITAGDVDALSYLKMIIRKQNLNHCLFSTWCIAADDILQFEEWLETGKIKSLDCYVGEIFPNQYKFEWQKLKEMNAKYGGRLAVFKNHSKIFAGVGDNFSFGIQTSANINTNPRTENGSISINNEIYTFYKDYFDGINSFEK